MSESRIIKINEGKIKIKDTIQKVDIYNGLYDN